MSNRFLSSYWVRIRRQIETDQSRAALTIGLSDCGISAFAASSDGAGIAFVGVASKLLFFELCSDLVSICYLVGRGPTSIVARNEKYSYKKRLLSRLLSLLVPKFAI